MSLLRAVHVVVAGIALSAIAAPAAAEEIWVLPTYQTDTGIGIGSNKYWPVTAAGMVRFAVAVPADFAGLWSARVALIPNASTSSGILHLVTCVAQHGDFVDAQCSGVIDHPFTATANQLLELDVTARLAPAFLSASVYVAVVAYTSPNFRSDHFVGLRLAYDSQSATLGANAFTGTQTAPAFVGSGLWLSDVAKLGANTFTGTQTAPAFVGSGLGLADVAKLGANTFNGTQTIASGDLDLGANGSILRNGGRIFHTTGLLNTAVGFGALAQNRTGYINVALGIRALELNTDGTFNAALGAAALASNTTGGRNTGVGGDALFYNTTGSSNTAVGKHALTSNTVGSGNVAVGDAAGSNATTGSNNIYLGAGTWGVAGESNTMYLGQGQTRTFIAGIRGVTTVNPNAIPVVIDSAGQLGTVSSSRRVKEDIRDMADASRRLFQLRPVTFRYTQPFAGGAKPIQFGLVAEEVAEVFPELAVRGEDGQVDTVHYEKLSVLLLNELQRQQRELDDWLARLTDQQERIETLQRQIESLSRDLAAFSQGRTMQR